MDNLKIDDLVVVEGRIHYLVDHGSEKHPYSFAGVNIDGRIVELPLDQVHKKAPEHE